MAAHSHISHPAILVVGAVVLCVLLGPAHGEVSTEAGGQCEFADPPVGVGYFWDPTCHTDGLGCHADKKHMECRFCGAGAYLEIPCPASSCQFPQAPYIPYYWDAECVLGQLGCFADGIHTQCRFCGDFPYTEVPCPEAAAAPPAAACAFDTEPEIPHYWEPGCALGMHGCNADGQNVQCRYCGQAEFSEIHCPGSQVCAFPNIPRVPYFYDPSCEEGILGCKADGVHKECRFCAEAPYEAVPCVAPAPGAYICHSTFGEQSVPYFWDETCDASMLGCYADGVHRQCRFCGGGEFTDVACPSAATGSLRGSR